METVVKMDGIPELVLDRLVALGYFRTKTEAIRAGVVGLGREYGLLATPQAIEDELVVRKMKRIDEEITAGKRKLIPLEDVLKENGMDG